MRIDHAPDRRLGSRRPALAVPPLRVHIDVGIAPKVPLADRANVA
jgi:hypothetical protein